MLTPSYVPKPEAPDVVRRALMDLLDSDKENTIETTSTIGGAHTGAHHP